MVCLGIESSCDETSAALVESGCLMRQVTATQEDIHALFGGVVPELASREHYRLLRPLLRRLFESSGQAGPRLQDVDTIAVARGPGLLGTLLVGMGFAKGLALGLDASLVGVNHLHAHLTAVGLEQKVQYPALGLLVSGGHTHLYMMHSALEVELLGRTLDDAAGEVFDKTAKMLNLPYPGGRHIDTLARGGEVNTALFPRPYLDNQNLDFSFSGLKTAVSLYLEKHPNLRLRTMGIPDGAAEDEHSQELRDVCASFNFAVADTLRVKTERALKSQRVKSLIVAGGAAANTMIRVTAEAIGRKHGLFVYLPSLSLCTDNAAMIAYLGEMLHIAGFSHGYDLDAIPRGRKIPNDYKASRLDNTTAIR